jgi:hypothetical protein
VYWYDCDDCEEEEGLSRRFAYMWSVDEIQTLFSFGKMW